MGDKLDSIFSEFVALADEEGCLCNCKGLNYGGGRTPTYDQPLEQLLYLLRYFPAYMAEYRRLFHLALIWFACVEGPVRALSIGCGAGLDLWSIKFALQGWGRELRCLAYEGYDLKKWRQSDTLGLPSAQIHVRDVKEVEEEITEKLGETHIMVFPKSLTDLSPAAFSAVERAIRNASFGSDKFILAVSFPSEGSLTEGQARMDCLSAILRDQHGMPVARPFSEDGDGKAIVKECPGFYYPDELKRKVANVISFCVRFRTGKCGETVCHLRSERSPVLKTEDLHIRVNFHQRREESNGLETDCGQHS